MPRRPVPRLIVRIIDEHRRRAMRLGDALDPHLFDAYPAGSNEQAARALNGTDLILVYDGPGAIDALDRAMLKAMTFVPFCAYGKPHDPRRVVSALRRGAIDYFLFPTDVTLNERALLAYSEGRKRSLRRLQFEKARIAIGNLSTRQYEIVVLAADGLTPRMIGRQLGLAQRTVEVHLNAAMRTLRLETEQQLPELKFALQHSHVDGATSNFKHPPLSPYEPGG